ncbi:hypothetical protein [Acinetobacter sp. A47]|uniref:portal protein n=1 Tax=Acinetobacter sp. A47 TaxID=1561217 RepID=UPI000570404E|nr:hypothetical protein [Acinetobacter sp. A47]
MEHQEPKPTTEVDRGLTDWAKEPRLQDLKLDLQEAQANHTNHIGRVDTWLDNLFVRGAAKVSGGKGRSQIVPKLIRKQAEWRYPALSEPFLSTSDLFKVDPVSHEDKKAALQNELVLNNQFQTKLNKTAFIDWYVRKAVNEGTVIVRVGWDFEEKEVIEPVPQFGYVIDPTVMEEYEQLAQMQQQEPDSYANADPALKAGFEMTQQTGQPIRAQVIGYTPQKQMKTVRNHPTVEVCDIRNVYIDPTCEGVLDKAQFIIHSFESSMSELKRDGRYKNLEKINVSNASTFSDPDHNYGDGTSTFGFNDDPRKKITVYEYWGYWDIDGSGIVSPIVATWVGNVLIRLEKNPFPDGKPPFVVVPYLPITGSVYGEPDGELLEDNQKILGAVTRGMVDLLGKSANSQTGMAKNMLDATNKIRYERGQDYEFNPHADPRTGIHMHTYPEFPNSAMAMLQLQNGEAESLTGVRAFAGQNGITGAGLGDTAAAVRGALDAASKREMAILRRLSTGILQIGRKIISMNAEFLSEEEIVRITNTEFVAIRRDDLAGEFDLRLSISTAESDQAKAQELAFMLQTMGNTMDPEMSRMLLADIARLHKLPDVAFKIETYQPQPDPFQQQMQALEMQKAQAEIALLEAQAMEAHAKAGLAGAKVPVEAARANNIQSDADKKDLEYVNNQTGVTHSREIDKEVVKQQGQIRDKMLQHEHEDRMAKLRHKSDLLKQHAQNSLASSKKATVKLT